MRERKTQLVREEVIDRACCDGGGSDGRRCEGKMGGPAVEEIIKGTTRSPSGAAPSA